MQTLCNRQHVEIIGFKPVIHRYGRLLTTITIYIYKQSIKEPCNGRLPEKEKK